MAAVVAMVVPAPAPMVVSVIVVWVCTAVHKRGRRRGHQITRDHRGRA